MKELIIEEKARAYDRALGRAKALYAKGAPDSLYLEEMFPELEESEDERIRKFLHHTFTAQYLAQDKLGKWHGEPVSNILAWLEKQGEQKMANKVEPVFKAGEWVVNTLTKEVEQIIELTGSEYICSGHLIVPYNEQHLLKSWAIEDARDGDVLAEDSCTFIIRELDYDNSDSANVYYCLHNDGTFDVAFGLVFDVESTHPATKEQRETLMKVMADTGYTFDFEKKELQKIEQASAVYIPKFRVGDLVLSIKNPHLTYKVLEAGHINENGESEYRVEIFVDDKPSSPSNIKYIRMLMMDECGRLIAQPTEWSEEDEKTIHLACELIRHHSKPMDSIGGIDCSMLIERLKSLRPQKQWKPSKEQIIALRWVLTNVPYNRHKEEISGLLDQIKDL